MTFLLNLKLATQGIFMHKDKLYQQQDRVSMGSPLAPTLVNFFLANVENKIMQSNHEFAPKLYHRFVDDIFTVFKSNCQKFHDLLNRQHKNIKFTVEHAKETIPFLNVEIKITDTGIET